MQKATKMIIKILEESIKIQTKINENSIKNPSKIYQKSMKMRYMGASWGDFGGLWAHVG